MRTKKGAALLLALLMLWALVPLEGVAAAGSPAIVSDAEKVSVGNTIWFGNYNSAPVQWRVLGDGNVNGDYKLLLSDRLLAETPFDPDVTSAAWQGSAVQSWCRDFYSNTLNAVEQSALLATTKDDPQFSATIYDWYPASTGILNGDHVFFLSAEEAMSYTFTDDASRVAYDLSGNAPGWWLRSPVAWSNSAGYVFDTGEVAASYLDNQRGARPAFNLKLDSVLFTSAATGGKTSGPLGPGALSAVPATDTTEWKLTLNDSTRSGFSINQVMMSSLYAVIDYTGAVTGPNEFISAVMKGDNSEEIKYYGRLAQPESESGRVIINLSDVSADSSRLFVISEQ